MLKIVGRIVAVARMATGRCASSAAPRLFSFSHRRLRATAQVFGMLVIATTVAAAQSAPSPQERPRDYRELRQNSQIFDPKPSFDTTPVIVRMGDVTYRIPRNYLMGLPPSIPTLKLTWPGLKPLSEETRKCFGSIRQSEQVGCTSLIILLFSSRGPGPGGRAFTNTEMFENAIKNPHIGKPKHGPFGYIIYEIGPQNARIDHYRKLEGDIFSPASPVGDQIENGILAKIRSVLKT